MLIVHAADLHLDSPMLGLARYDGAPTSRLRLATRHAFTALIDQCLELDARLLLLAGDLYDGDWRDYTTGLFFLGELARLADSGCRVLFIRGNHDAQSRITRELRLPEHVQEFDCKHPESKCFEDLGIAVHGQGFARAAVTEDLAAAYPDPVPGLLNIGLLHTSLGGRPGHEPYAPCSQQRLEDLGYDYWALGHVHQREVVSAAPYIVYPGNLQGRHARETGEKGATLLESEGGRIQRVEPLVLDVVRWSNVEVQLEEVSVLDDALERVEVALTGARQAAEDRLLAARVTLTGASPLHAVLAADSDRMLAEVRLIAGALDDVWIEKLRVETRERVDLEARAAEDDLLAQVARAFDLAAADPEMLADLGAQLGDLRQKLPTELRQGPEALRLDDEATLVRALGEAKQVVLARLLQREG